MNKWLKRKLFVRLVLMLVVVGYAYIYYNNAQVKSIDSYESCAAAKGSVIQESYPATCVTRLGYQFTQKVYGVLPILNSNGWKIFKSKFGYEFSFPNEWEIDDSKYGDDHTGNITILYKQEGKSYYLTTVAAGREGPRSNGVADYQITIDGKPALKRVWIYKNRPELISVMPDFEVPFNHIEITVPAKDYQQYLKVVDQILGSFKFTN